MVARTDIKSGRNRDKELTNKPRIEPIDQLKNAGGNHLVDKSNRHRNAMYQVHSESNR